MRAEVRAAPGVRGVDTEGGGSQAAQGLTGWSALTCDILRHRASELNTTDHPSFRMSSAIKVHQSNDVPCSGNWDNHLAAAGTKLNL